MKTDFKEFLKEGLGQTVYVYFNTTKGGDNLDGGEVLDKIMIFATEATCVKEMLKDLDNSGDGDSLDISGEEVGTDEDDHQEYYKKIKTIKAFEDLIEGNDFTPSYQVKKYKLR